MSWPTHTDYQDAIQNPQLCFDDPDLKQGEAKCDMLGLPRVTSGNFACIYELATPQGRWAIRCFVRQVAGRQSRYAGLSQYLERLTLPCLVQFDYIQKGIVVRGEWYSIVKMQWVDGLPLNTWIEDHLQDPAALLKLAADWREMMGRLREHNLAHGDLQHGNVMVTPQNELRLVDYDGMYVPVFGRGRAPELGHANFQHPRRTADFYREDLDNFSAIVIYTTLRALAAEPALFDKFYTVDNLVLSAGDFKAPMTSPVLEQLQANKDPAVPQLAKLIQRCCCAPVESVPEFGDVTSALDAGTLDIIPLKTAVAPRAFSRPAPAADDAEEATRSPYDRARTAPAQSFSRPAPAPVPSPEPVLAPEADRGVSPWVWCVAALAVVLVVALSIFSNKPPKTAAEGPSDDLTEAMTLDTDIPPARSSAASVAVSPPTEPSQRNPIIHQPINPTVRLTLLGTLQGHAGTVGTLAFAADHKTLASGSSDRTVKLWDAQTGQLKRTLSGSADDITAIAFATDGRVVAVSADNLVRLWDGATGELKRVVDDYADNQFTVGMASGATVLAVGTTDRRTVLLVDLKTGARKAVLAGHSSWLRSVTFSRDGQWLVSTCFDDTIRLWNAGSGQLTQTVHAPGNAFETIPISDDNKFLASAEGQTLTVWEARGGTVKQQLKEHPGEIKTGAFSSSGGLLAAGCGDHSIRVWDRETGRLVQQLSGHAKPVTALAFSTDGKLLASGSEDQTIKLWEINESR